MAAIEILTGQNAGETHVLEHRETLIGRHPDCGILLKDSTVSRRHARITRQTNGQFVLDDVGSQHGTKVNGELLRGSHLLQDQDQLIVSQTLLLFHAFHGAQATDSVPDRPSTIVTSVDVLHDSSTTGDSQGLPKWRALLEIMKTLGGSLELSTVLPNVLDNVIQILPSCTRGAILLQEGNRLRLRPFCHKARSGAKDVAPAVSRTMVAAVMAEGKAILINDPNEDERFQASDSVFNLELRSVLCAPLIGRAETPYGMIVLDAQTPGRPFQSDDLEVLVNIANLVAQAIDHVNLHQTQLQFDRRDRDMETARQVQQLFLPRERPRIEGYQLCDYYNPADAVGGDYFGYTQLPDGPWAIGVGDVAGHGVPAALLMARLCSEARYCLVTDIIASDAVRSLNRQLCRQPYSYFITFALCVLDPVRHTLTIVNAGHSPPLLRRARTGLVEEVGAEIVRPPLGIDRQVEFAEATVQLEPGDLAVLFTDGIFERPNPVGDRYGMERLEAVLAASRHAEDFVAACLRDVQNFSQGAAQEDDACIVAFSRAP